MSASAAVLHARLAELRADPAVPRAARAQAFQEWFRQSVAEGNPPDRLRRDAPTWSERFDASVIEGLDGCLLWDGPVANRATGRVPVIKLGGRELSARFYALQRDGVSVPPNRRVVASCGQPLCVRTEHLTVETHHWARTYTRENMLARLQVMALRLGETPTTRRWDEERGKPVSSYFGTIFGSWSEAVKAAGLPPAVKRSGQKPSNPAACLQGIRALARKLNRAPFTTDIARNADWLAEQGHPCSATTYFAHLGSPWSAALDRAGVQR